MKRFFIKNIFKRDGDMLCVCDRHVDVNDRVRTIHFPDDKEYQNSWDDVTVNSIGEDGVQVSGQKVDGWVGLSYIYKVAHEVPQDFKWQNDGDEFDEEDLKMYYFGKKTFIKKKTEKDNMCPFSGSGRDANIPTRVCLHPEGRDNCHRCRVAGDWEEAYG